MQQNKIKISVIGAGAWGTALAHVFGSAGFDVMLMAREEKLAEDLQKTRVNETYLPRFKLAQSVMVTSDAAQAFNHAEYILHVIPAQYMRGMLECHKNLVKAQHKLILCSKGIEVQTGLLLSEVARQILPKQKIAALTGPSFAHDLMAGKPTAATLASDDAEFLNKAVEQLNTTQLRLYKSSDLIGAQIGGAVKNVLAIAAGLSDGLGFGESARAALMTRGLAEMARLSDAFGGKKETLMGQCGVGDLMLTSSSPNSRNYSFGFQVGQGKSVAEILSARKSVTEGVFTAKALVKLCESHGVDMPLVMSVHHLIEGTVSAKDLFSKLANRPTRFEQE